MADFDARQLQIAQEAKMKANQETEQAYKKLEAYDPKDKDGLPRKNLLDIYANKLKASNETAAKVAILTYKQAEREGKKGGPNAGVKTEIARLDMKIATEYLISTDDFILSMRSNNEISRLDYLDALVKTTESDIKIADLKCQRYEQLNILEINPLIIQKNKNEIEYQKALLVENEARLKLLKADINIEVLNKKSKESPNSAELQQAQKEKDLLSSKYQSAIKKTDKTLAKNNKFESSLPVVNVPVIAPKPSAPIPRPDIAPGLQALKNDAEEKRRAYITAQEELLAAEAKNQGGKKISPLSAERQKVETARIVFEQAEKIFQNAQVRANTEARVAADNLNRAAAQVSPASVPAPVPVLGRVPALDPHEAKSKDAEEKRLKLKTSQDSFKAAVLAVREAERAFKDAKTALQGVPESEPGHEAAEQRENQTNKEYESALENYQAAKKDRTEAFKDSQEAYNNVNADPRTSFDALMAQAATALAQERVKKATGELSSAEQRLKKAEVALNTAQASGVDTAGLQREVKLATALKNQAEANVIMKEADLEVSKLKEYGYPIPVRFTTQFKLATAKDSIAYSNYSLAEANVNLVRAQNALEAETVDNNKPELTAQVQKYTAEKNSSEAYSEFRTASMKVLDAENEPGEINKNVILASMNEEIAQAKFVAANVGIEVLILEQKVSKIPVNGPSKNVAEKMLEAARERETTAKAIVENLEAVKAASNDPNDISALLDKEAKLITEKEKHAASEEAFFKAGQQVAKQELDAREIEYVQQQFDDEGRRLESREQRLEELQSELDEAEDVDKPGLDRDIKSLTKDIDIDKAKIEISQARLKVLEAKMNSDFNYNADEKPALEKIVKKAEGKLKEAEANEKVVRAEVEVTYLTERLEEVQREFDVADEKSKPGLAVQIKECKAFKEIYIAKAKLADSELKVVKADNALKLDLDNPGLARKLELANLHQEISRADVTVAEKTFEVVRNQNIVNGKPANASQNEKDIANSALKEAISAKILADAAVKTLVQDAAIKKADNDILDARISLPLALAEVAAAQAAVDNAERELKQANDASDVSRSIAAQAHAAEAHEKLESAQANQQKIEADVKAAQAAKQNIFQAVIKARAAIAPVTAAQLRVDEARPKHEDALQTVRDAQAEVASIRALPAGDRRPENLERAQNYLAEKQAEAKITAAELAEAEAELKEARSQQELAEKEVDEIIDPPKKQADDNKAALTMREFIKAVERSDDLRARAGAQWSRLQKSDFGKALGEAGDRLNKNVKGFSGHHMGEAELLEAALFNMLLLLFEILFGAGKVAKAGVKEVYKQVNRNHLSSQDLRKLSLKDHKAALEEAKKYKDDPANKDKLDAALLKMAQAEATHEKHGSKASEAEYNKLKKDYDGVNKSLIDARKKYVAAKAEHELMSFSDRFKDPTKGQEVNRLEEQVRELEVSELNAYLKIKELDTKTDKISPELEAMKADREAAGFDDTVMNAPREKYKDVQRYGELQENITELNAEKERLGTKAVDLKLELEDCEKNGSKYGANQEAIEAQKTKIQKSIKTNADKMAANATGMRDALEEMNGLGARIEADPAQKQMVKAEKTRTEKLFGKRAVEWMVKNLVDVPIPIVSNAAGVAPIAVPVSDPLSKPVISVQAGDNPDEEKPNIWSKFVGKIRSLGRSKPDETSMQLMSLEMGDEEAQHKHDASEPELTAVAGPNPASPVAPSVSSSVDAVPVPPLEDNRNDRVLFSVTHSEPALKLTPEPSEISANADKNAEARAAEALRVEAESKRFFEQGNSEPLSVTPRSFQLAQADISPRSPDSLVEQIISIQEQSKQGPMQSPDVIPRFKALMEFGGKHQALLNAKAKIETLEPDATEIDKLKVSLVFLYNASRKDPTSGWTVEDQIGLDQVTRELEGNRDFQEQLKALSENQAKEAEALPKQNARAGSLQAEADRKKPIFPRSLSEGNSPSNSRSEPPPEPPTSGSRIKRSSSR